MTATNSSVSDFCLRCSLGFMFCSIIVSFSSSSSSLLMVHAQECNRHGICDTHERCPVWREEGECYRNPEYMRQHCPMSCFDVDLEEGAKRRAAGECSDIHPRCSVWASDGECLVNRVDMLKNCPESCDACSGGSSCLDYHTSCEFWFEKGECEANPGYMKVTCPKSCGICEVDEQQQRITQQQEEGEETEESKLLKWTETIGVRQEALGAHKDQTLLIIEATKKYVEAKSKVLSKQQMDKCKNLHEHCSFWAAVDECPKNSVFMKSNCAAACNFCHL